MTTEDEQKLAAARKESVAMATAREARDAPANLLPLDELALARGVRDTLEDPKPIDKRIDDLLKFLDQDPANESELLYRVSLNDSLTPREQLARARAMRDTLNNHALIDNKIDELLFVLKLEPQTDAELLYRGRTLTTGSADPADDGLDIDSRIADAESNLEALKREKSGILDGWEVVTERQWRRVVADRRAELCVMINHVPTIVARIPVLLRRDLSLPDDARGVEDVLIEWCRAVLDELGEPDEPEDEEFAHR